MATKLHGANVSWAKMQGADLTDAEVVVSSEEPGLTHFVARMREQVGERAVSLDSELYAGSVPDSIVTSTIEVMRMSGVDSDQIDYFQSRMEAHNASANGSGMGPNVIYEDYGQDTMDEWLSLFVGELCVAFYPNFRLMASRRAQFGVGIDSIRVWSAEKRCPHMSSMDLIEPTQDRE